MRTLVLGGDGYLGWPSALHLSSLGHDVAVADNFVRRSYDQELGVTSLVADRRCSSNESSHGVRSRSRHHDYSSVTCPPAFARSVIREFRP